MTVTPLAMRTGWLTNATECAQQQGFPVPARLSAIDLAQVAVIGPYEFVVPLSAQTSSSSSFPPSGAACFALYTVQSVCAPGPGACELVRLLVRTAPQVPPAPAPPRSILGGAVLVLPNVSVVQAGAADVCPGAAWCVGPGGGWMAWLAGFVGPLGVSTVTTSLFASTLVGVDPDASLWLDAQRAGQTVWAFFL